MQFAILFVLAFLAGVGLYIVLRNWIPTVIVPLMIFVVTTFMDNSAREAWMFTFVFGIPIVFVGSLLGAYVVQTRTAEEEK